MVWKRLIESPDCPFDHIDVTAVRQPFLQFAQVADYFFHDYRPS